MDVKIFPSPLCGEISAISSKSDVHRAAFAAALAKGVTKIRFSTLSEDIAATLSVLSCLGAEIEITENEGGCIASVCGTKDASDGITLDANECGTTARLILPVAAALTGSFTLTGHGGLVKRPFFDLCKCMGENGTATSSDTLPIVASGRLQSGVYRIRGDISSQYISGLLFALPLLCGDSEIRLTTPLASAGYVDMTLKTLSHFGISIEKTDYGFFVKGSQRYVSCGEYICEGDWSNSSFWLAAGAVGGKVKVKGLSCDSLQRDKDVLNILKGAGAGVSVKGSDVTVCGAGLEAVSFSGDDMPDALPILATVLSLANGKSEICGGARLKIKESDRIKSTADMLASLGGRVAVTDDGFIIDGVSSFSGGEVDAAGDHRIAMCASVAGSVSLSPVIIHGAECVAKSYPTFFEDFERLGGKYCVIDR